MKQDDARDPASQAVAERFEIFLDEATAIAGAWFGEIEGTARASLIVQIASSLMHSESTGALEQAIKSMTRERV